MKNHDKVSALRRRVDAEREAAGAARVRFSDELKSEALSMLGKDGWGCTALGGGLGISPSVIERWAKRVERATAGRLRHVQVVGDEAAATVASVGTLEIRFPGGARVCGLTLGQLAQLLGGER